RHQPEGVGQRIAAAAGEHSRLQRYEHRLLRIDDQRVTQRQVLEAAVQPRRETVEAAVRGIDVQPYVVVRADLGDRLGLVGGGDAGRADRRDHGHGPPAGADVAADRLVQQVGTHPVALVGRYAHDIGKADAERDAGLVNRTVRLVGGIDPQRRY